MLNFKPFIMKEFSCLMSCYAKDDPAYLAKALFSLSAQTVKAAEILLVEDGPLTKGLYQVIDSFKTQLPLNSLKFEENRGLGYALKKGVEACSYNLIARMDADDISRKDRFEKELKILSQNPELSLVGSWVSEFEEKEERIYALRKVPSAHAEIMKMAKYRCPVNHVTVMYRKEAVLNSGNYNPRFRFAQDYVLWISMLSHGYKFANIPECLVNVKAGQGMIKRRGGREYMNHEIALQKEFLRQRFISHPQFYFNVGVRSILRLMPNQWRGLVYQKLLRT